MPTCPVQPLFDLSACFDTLTIGQKLTLILQLLCIQVNGDPMATCDVQALFDDAKCFATLPTGDKMTLILQLLCDGGGGGGAGGGVITRGSGPPENVITGGIGAGQYLGYIDTDDCSFYQFNGVYGTAVGWC